jgi:hypothetical protein
VELEQRVKALEYEMKILKNEIQKTLLGIQEQILVHYYPSLRTDDSAPSEGTILAFESVRAKQVNVTPSKPIARKVSLEDIRAGRHQAQSDSPSHPADRSDDSPDPSGVTR